MPSNPTEQATVLDRKRKPNAYDRGQHDLICKALKVSNDPNAPGLTAYEAVCIVLFKLDVARGTLIECAEHGDKEARAAIKFLARKPESFTTIKCY